MSHEKPSSANVARRRRVAAGFIAGLLVAGTAACGIVHEQQSGNGAPAASQSETNTAPQNSTLATSALAKLAIKGRAPKTGYSREQFGGEWADAGACDIRNKILQRDLVDTRTRSDTDCTVMSGTLHDPYTGKAILFVRGPSTSSVVQIDHVVAISDAWQTGAQQLSLAQRKQLYNDPLELLAVDGAANNQKGDGDTATWLPSNKEYRCRYVARQIAVKETYNLWVTQAEHDAMARVLDACPAQVLPIEQ